jgi:hypothetical protein
MSVDNKPPDDRVPRRAFTPTNPIGKVVVQFDRFDVDGPWCLSTISQSELRSLLGRIKSIETVTVGEAFNQTEEPGKDYPIGSLSNKTAIERLVELRSPACRTPWLVHCPFPCWPEVRGGALLCSPSWACQHFEAWSFPRGISGMIQTRLRPSRAITRAEASARSRCRGIGIVVTAPAEVPDSYPGCGQSEPSSVYGYGRGEPVRHRGARELAA